MIQSDLVEADEARALLKMPPAKFELLIESGQLKVFRSGGRLCFRREDLSTLLNKRKAQFAQPPFQPAATAATPSKSEKLKTAARATPSEARNTPSTQGRPAAVKHTLARSRLKFVPVLAAVAMLCIGLITFSSLHHHEDALVPARNDAAAPARRAVTAPGRVEAASGIRNISFDIPGRLKSVCVDEGQSVTAGQLVAELENDDFKAKVDSARATLAVAQAKLRMTSRNLDAELIRAQKDAERLAAELELLKAGPRPEDIARAAAEVDAAQAEAERAASDAKRFSEPDGLRSGAWSVRDRDNALHAADAASARLNAARQVLAALKSGSRKEDISRAAALLHSAQAEVERQTATRQFQIDAARAQAEQAAAELANAEAGLKKTCLYAPIAGTVIWKFLHGGEAIDPLQRQPVIAIADTTRLRVRASVDEADYPQIHTGQRVSITADAFDGHAFAGRVELIGDSAGEKPFSTGQARERVDVRVIEVLIALEGAVPLKLGLRVTANFERP